MSIYIQLNLSTSPSLKPACPPHNDQQAAAHTTEHRVEGPDSLGLTEECFCESSYVLEPENKDQRNSDPVRKILKRKKFFLI